MEKEKWIPVIEQSIKSSVVLILCLLFVPQIISILSIVQERMVSGSSFSIGPNGLSLGEAPKIPESKPLPVGGLASPRGLGGGNVKGVLTRGLSPEMSQASLDDMFYVVHAAQKVNPDLYDVIIRLGAHNDKAFQYIDRVVYHLHDSFDDPTREVTDPSKNFELKVSAWGQFEIKADVYVSGATTPIKLKRFLNF